MKTTKYIFSMILVALTTVSFGQRSFVMERIFPQKESRSHFAKENNSERNRIEIWRHDLQNRLSKKVTWEVYDNPMVVHSFLVEQVEVIYEEGLDMEKWMTRPFESGLGEERLRVESWMTLPFENSLEEKDLSLESWMTVPFEYGLEEKDLSLESWMIQPFYGVLSEVPLALESWMTRPFNSLSVDGMLRVEQWMRVPFETFEYMGPDCCLAHTCI